MDFKLMIICIFRFLGTLYEGWGTVGYSAYTYPDDVEEKADYVEVRPGAHMFYLIQYTTHPFGYSSRPWVIWIQGGPGRSGAGYGNYVMFGPEDMNGNIRNDSWVTTATIVYVDNPVGTGFSYLDPGVFRSITTDDISTDLVEFLIGFLQQNPEFSHLPLYVFGQSYGGRMALTFTHYLQQRLLSGGVDCNLKAVAIGNGWVSPIDFIENWPNMLFQMSAVDRKSRDTMFDLAKLINNSYQQGDLGPITSAYLGIMRIIHSNAADVYNIIKTTPSIYTDDVYYRLKNIMDNKFKSRFNDVIPPDVRWIGKDNELFNQVMGTNAEFIHPVYQFADSLLHNSSVQVIIYSGQLDVICCTSGALAWADRLTWPGMTEYYAKERTALFDPDTEEAEMYVKAHEKFKVYWMLNAGHVVPRDVPGPSLRMLNRILNNNDH